MYRPTSKYWIAILLPVAAVLAAYAAEIRLTDLRSEPDPHTHTNFVPRRFETAAAWTSHRDQIRKQVLATTGLWPMPTRGPVRTRSYGRLVRKGYVVEKLLIETLPGFYVGANVYYPEGRRRRRPGVLIAHGHWKHGRVEHSDVYSVPALGAQLAANGYVALAYDMVGYSDTRQVPHKFGDSDKERAWSYGPLALQLWNSLRMLDYLSARRDIDPARLAITGASGGGTQTYLLAAVDDRIQVSIPAVMVSAKFQGDDPCEMAPGLRIGTNNVELAAVVAPKPMLLLSTSRDWTSNVPTIEYPAIREIYGLLGWANRVESLHVDSEHGYNAEQRMAALRFLGKYFNVPGPVREGESFSESPSEFLVGAKEAAAIPGALDREGVFLAWQRLMTSRNQTMTKGQRVELLRILTGARIPVKPILVATRGEGFLHRDGESDVVPARIVTGDKSMSIVAVHGKGADSALKMRAVKEAQAAGAQIIAIDSFGTASSSAAPRGRHGDHLVFHHSDDANRVQDILTAASWMAGQGAPQVRLQCGGGAESWCRLAAAVSPIALTVLTESEHTAEPGIPGLLAAGYSAAAQ